MLTKIGGFLRNPTSSHLATFLTLVFWRHFKLITTVNKYLLDNININQLFKR